MTDFVGRIRVRPGTSRVAVGGGYGPDRRLVVAVSAPALDGRANDAVISALADALGVRRSRIRITAGTRGRDKTVAVDVAAAEAEDLASQWERLLGDGA